MFANLITVVHEFCKIEKRLSDFRNLLRLKGRLEGGQELVLQIFIHVTPSSHERHIEEVLGHLRVCHRHGVNSSEDKLRETLMTLTDKMEQNNQIR